MRLLPRICGWKSCDFTDYQRAWEQFGGSVLANPEILKFIHSRLNPQESFWAIYDRKNVLKGAVCIWGNHVIAGDKRYAREKLNFSYPLNTDEIALPLAADLRVILPWKTRFLSALNYNQVRNTSYLLNAQRQICLAHNLKRKSRLKRNNELKRFIQAGGSVHAISEFSRHELVSIFTDLMYQRRNVTLNPEPLHDILSALPDLLFGHILKFNHQPCAMQWIVKSESPQYVWLDYVNNAMSLALPDLYIGSVLSWVNIQAAFTYAQQRGKILRYSFGTPSSKYKDLWCDRVPLCRILA